MSNSMDELLDSRDTIRSHLDLASFVDVLRRHMHDEPEQWENANIDRYLEGLSACIRSLPRKFENQGLAFPDKLSWKNIGDLLMCAGIHE